MIGLIEIIILILCILMSVAYFTIAERKTLAYMQRRLGPNMVGYYGLLMCFADALKLLLKEIILPRDSNYMILVISPLITLVFGLLGWGVIPFGPGITLGNIEYGILYALAISSVGVFGTLLAGWSSNSKYPLLGSIRSTAQLISYELVLTTIILIVLMFVNDLNITTLVESQRAIWYIIPLLPLFMVFYIASVAETNRPPFDNVEAESELVAGFFTEYSGAPFVFFFLAEYSNIILICTLNTILFMGSYIPFNLNILNYFNLNNSYPLYLIEGLIYGLSFGIKTIILMFTFIWVRAAFPRLRYDLLINFCWLYLLPILFGIILFIPCIAVIFDALPV